MQNHKLRSVLSEQFFFIVIVNFFINQCVINIMGNII